MVTSEEMQLNILHVLVSAGVGGIETLCKDYALNSRNNNIFLTLFSAGEIAAEIRQSGYDVINLKLKKYDFTKLYKQLCNICISNNIDIVIVHHPAPLAYLAVMQLKARYPEIKVVVYAHSDATNMGRSFEKKGKRFRKFVISKAMHKADSVIAISKSVKQSVIKYFDVSYNHIQVVYNGVDTAKFYPSGDSESSNVLQIVYVGRLIKLKGVQNILHVLSMLPSDIEYSFKIVGDGPYRSNLEYYVNEHKLNEKVQFLGERRDVPSILRESDIFIHVPEVKEGFGITVIEAMASGLVCVCRPIGGIKEIITNNYDGFLVDSAKELKECILYYIEHKNSEEMQKIRKNAISTANGYSVTSFADNLDNKLADLMKI